MVDCVVTRVRSKKLTRHSRAVRDGETLLEVTRSAIINIKNSNGNYKEFGAALGKK